MKALKFIHCGDLHLDAGFVSSGFSEVEAKVRRQELKNAFARIIDEVIGRSVDIFLVSGDFFEHEYVSKHTIDFIVKQLYRIPGVSVFISPGNHDPFVGNSYYSLIEWPANVHIFGKNFEGVRLDDLNAIVYGAGFTARTQYESMLTDLKDLCKSETALDLNTTCYKKILLMHGTIDGDLSNCPYNPISSKEIDTLGFDYCALGHYHRKIEYLKGKAIYSGSPEPLGFDEMGEHGIIFGTIDYRNKVETEFIKMNICEYVTLNIDISSSESLDELESLIQEEIKDKKDDFINIVLCGTNILALNFDKEFLLARFEESCRHLRIIDKTYHANSIEEIKDFNNIKGIFAKMIMNKIEEIEDEEEKDMLYRALKLGLESLDA